MDDFINQIMATGGVWLPIALIAAMILMQGAKAVIKQLMAERCPTCRRWLTFGLAYLIGYQCGRYFLDGDAVTKWAVMVGLINPVAYYALVQWARVSNRLVLLSILKMRPVIANADGSMSLHETQTFMVKKQ